MFLIRPFQIFTNNNTEEINSEDKIIYSEVK